MIPAVDLDFRRRVIRSISGSCSPSSRGVSVPVSETFDTIKAGDELATVRGTAHDGRFRAIRRSTAKLVADLQTTIYRKAMSMPLSCRSEGCVEDWSRDRHRQQPPVSTLLWWDLQ
jgi:hypothetical protein